MFTKLNGAQIDKKKSFIENYKRKQNPATASAVDANANVEMKNIATLEAEINKDINIQINRAVVGDKIQELFGPEMEVEYNRQIESHEIYVHDESSLKPYCVSMNMYPMLNGGLKGIGLQAEPPKHIKSFAGNFINLVYAVAAQFAGAVATVEFLMYFDHFARLEFGEGYMKNMTPVLYKEISQLFQEIVYSINQPAAARGYQCVREDTTQLSTPEGYKYLHELKEGDLCYVWKDGKIKIEEIQKLNVHNFDGELLQFKGRNYQQTVTENHRVLYKKPNTDEYSIKEAHELFGHSKLSLPIASELEDREDYPISDELLQLLTVVLTDGTIDGNGVKIYKSPNRWGAEEIPTMLDTLGYSYKIKDCTTNEFGEVNIIELDSFNSQTILRLLKHTKKEIPYFFKTLSKRQLELVIDVWTKTDGSSRKGNRMMQCDNEDIRDMLQEITFLAGYGSEIYDREMTKFNSDEKCIVKYVKIFERKDKRVSEYNKIQYKGKVWCPTTDAGVVIFREENGIPYISGNSVFWNISIYDEYYFESLFGDFQFPDGDKPSWESLEQLQKLFMKWFNAEREKAVLTFPVITAAMLVDDKQALDDEFEDFLAEEMSEGNAFFVYQSESADSLASCCRLRNEITDTTFSYSLGAGGVSTGSINVITINFNRLIQDGRNLGEEIDKIHKYQIAYRKVVEEYKAAKLLPVYDAGFISLDKQFLTIGINGMVEAAEFLGLKADNNDEYKAWVSGQLKIIYDKNRELKKTTGYMFNTEFVPAENLGVKNSKWDKKDGYAVNRDCYNSYFYVVEDEDTTPLDKFMLHGKEATQYLDGGSALHLNLEETLTKANAVNILRISAKTGCNYFCTNIKVTICNEESCGYIDKATNQFCTKCGSKDIDYGTRVIGYLKRIKSFSKDRQTEEGTREYHDAEKED